MRNKIYVIKGYKPETEAYGPQDSDILGYTTSKEKCRNLIKRFKDKYLPKYLTYSIIDMIGWKFGDNFNAFLSSGLPITKEASPEELRKDWEKYGGGWKRLIYSNIDYEEVELLHDTGELPECRYRRSIIEKE